MRNLFNLMLKLLNQPDHSLHFIRLFINISLVDILKEHPFR